MCTAFISDQGNRDWQFQSEQALEDFVWEHLEPLFGLKTLSRQTYINNQICDILAVNQHHQLTVIELKNTEDRFIVQQLTRYYNSLIEIQPFPEQVNYNLPIRLLAIAPRFHPHNQIDRKYNRLEIEFCSFQLIARSSQIEFELRQESELIVQVSIPPHFYPYLQHDTRAALAPQPQLPPPPKSLQRLLERLEEAQQNYVLAVRDNILRFDNRIQEVGLTTTTRYGLRKGQKDVYNSKLCAEIIPSAPGVYIPYLRLFLPYAKRELAESGRVYKKEPVKGLAWVGVRHDPIWHPNTSLKLYFHLGKSRSGYSSVCDIVQYSRVYRKLTGQERSLHTLEDVVLLALEEWKQRVARE